MRVIMLMSALACGGQRLTITFSSFPLSLSIFPTICLFVFNRLSNPTWGSLMQWAWVAREWPASNFPTLGTQVYSFTLSFQMGAGSKPQPLCFGSKHYRTRPSPHPLSPRLSIVGVTIAYRNLVEAAMSYFSCFCFGFLFYHFSFLLLGERVSCSPDQPWTSYVAQAALKLLTPDSTS